MMNYFSIVRNTTITWAWAIVDKGFILKYLNCKMGYGHVCY